MSCSVGLCLFCGLPGSGKTTLANYVCQRENVRFIHICYDSLMPLIDHKKTTISPWKMARSTILHIVESILQFFKFRDAPLSLHCDNNIVQSELQLICKKVEEIDSDVHIVLLVDDNMQYRGMRREYYQICAKLEIGFSIVYFDIPMKKCIENNQKRDGLVSADVISKLNLQLEIPGKNLKCKWEKHVCFLQDDDLSHLPVASEKVMEIIQSSKLDPVFLPQDISISEIEMARARNRGSFVHQADICMRRYISTEIDRRKRSFSSVALRELSHRLVFIKKKLLSLMKAGYIEEDNYLCENGIVDVEKLQEKISEWIIMELN